MATHYRHYIAICQALTVMLAAAAGAGYAGLFPPKLTLLIVAALAIAVILTWRPIMRLLHDLWIFVTALEMKDYKIRFHRCSDKKLDDIYHELNNIIIRQRDDAMALETKKLYYDRILRVMTHELRNSITPIAALSDDMKKHPSRYTDRNLAEAVNILNHESSVIKNFLDSYYELTHLPAPKTVITDVKEFFRRIDKSISLQSLTPHTDIITYTIASGMKIDMDPDLMHRVMVNLIKNAAEATADKENPHILITASLPEGHPMITISDNGCGMTGETVDNLFQPFYTTKTDGNGIGLSLSRQIIRLHGGDIKVISSPGRGTTIHITFP